MSSERKIKVWLLRKLSRQRCWGKGHISSDNIVKGQPKNKKKEVLGIADKMVKEGFLVKFPHGNEKHYYMNPEMRIEIKKIIEENIEV